MKVEVRREGRGLSVAFPYDPDLVAGIRDVPGAEWDKAKRVWRIPRDLHSLAVLMDTASSYEIDLEDGLREWAREEFERMDVLSVLRAADDAKDLLYEHAHLLRPYQRVAVRFFAEAGRGLLADEMGLGKTVELIATIRELELRGATEEQLHLIVCPNSMRHPWESEIRAWYPEDVEVFHVRDGRELVNPAPGFYIVNWEKTHRRERLAQVRWETVTCDESHRMKGRDTKQSKAVRKFKARHRFLLSGTPIKNDITDLWAQLNFIDPDRWSSFWKFFNRYADYREGFFGREVIGVRNTEELNKRLDGTMMTRALADVDLQLPPVIERRIVVDLEGEQRQAYDQMRDEFVAYVSSMDDVLMSVNWMTQSLRLKQLAGSLGIFSLTSHQSAKIDALMDLLEEVPPHEKMVVMSQFRTMVDQTTHRLREAGIPYCEMTGETCLAWMKGAGTHNAPNRGELIDWFQTSDKPRVFIATTQTGGEGITLTAARYFAFLDLMWTPGDNRQAWKRVHRYGQSSTCFVYTILARDTIDFSGILPKLRTKQAVIDAVMNPKSDPPPVEDGDGAT